MIFKRGHSSAGRAPAWHAGGQRFESAWLHQGFRMLYQLVWSIIHNNPYRIIMDKYGLLWAATLANRFLGNIE